MIKERKLTRERVQEQIRQLGELIHEMENILEGDSDDSPLAFFEACEDAQHHVTSLMRLAFLAVQSKPG